MNYHKVQFEICPNTGKRGYRDQLDAEIVLGGIRYRGVRDPVKGRPKNVYKCIYCGLWHLTTQPKERVDSN